MNSPLQPLRRAWVRQAVSQGLSMLGAREFIRDKALEIGLKPEIEFAHFCCEHARYTKLVGLKRHVDLCDGMNESELFIALGWALEGSYSERRDVWNREASAGRMKIAIRDMQEFCIPPMRRYVNEQ